MLDTAQPADLDRLVGQLNRAMDQMVRTHFSHFVPTDTWQPAINAYRLDDRIEVCVDLAGVAREAIDVRVEPGKLTIRGVRHAPEPSNPGGRTARILAMEIDHGPFQRSLALPRQVQTTEISAEQKNGLLWIRLPFGEEA